MIPARNEAERLRIGLPALLADLGPEDELVIVDDASTDGTGDVAAGLGARVIRVEGPPPGWAGKPHACWQGVHGTTAPILVFLDADVHAGPELVDRLAQAVLDTTGSLVSVQPWHTVRTWSEQISMLFNLVSVMATGAFARRGSTALPPRLAFGPVLACRREDYLTVGGHGASAVRGAVAEDLALAQCFSSARPLLARPDEVTYRMYPDGVVAAINGWTKNFAVGVRSAPWWATLAVIAWMWSLGGGWLASPWFAMASVIQLTVLVRRIGSFSPLTVALYPLGVIVVVVVLVRSILAAVTGRRISWKGRGVTVRQRPE